jgi:hypothetical protein
MTGALPDTVVHVTHARTSRSSCWAFADGKRRPQADHRAIKRTLKLYPHVQGGDGTSVATLLAGKARPGSSSSPPETTFIEASGKAGRGRDRTGTRTSSKTR